MYWNAILADAAAPASTGQAATTTASTGQASSPGQGTPPAPLFSNPLFLVIPLVLIMYFMMIRPQSQQRKQLAKLMASLKAGDRVVTASGIIGVVITVKDKTVSLRSADSKMEVTKSSITEILENADASPSAS
jgi:preprotein translocase subunit YajC